MSFKTLVAFAICGLIAMGIGIHALHRLEAGFAANSAAVDAAIAAAEHPAAVKQQQKEQKPRFVPIDQWEAQH